MRAPKQSNSPERDDGPTRQTAAKLAPPRMATPARADRITVEELLKLAEDGRLRVPNFQRALRWDANDKWKLLDSMERGYPIGRRTREELVPHLSRSRARAPVAAL